MKKYVLNLEEQRQLQIAQKKLESGVWRFRQYSEHLSAYVFRVK